MIYKNNKVNLLDIKRDYCRINWYGGNLFYYGLFGESDIMEIDGTFKEDEFGIFSYKISFPQQKVGSKVTVTGIEISLLISLFSEQTQRSI